MLCSLCNADKIQTKTKTRSRPRYIETKTKIKIHTHITELISYATDNQIMPHKPIACENIPTFTTMGCHNSKAIVGPRIPLSNESCIRLVRTENKSYQTADVFFLGGYPPQQSFRNRISETEWRSLNIEFLEASKSSQSLTSRLFLQRHTKIDEIVAKANRYIFRPRSMYMKKLSYTHIYDEYNITKYYWYEIAMTQTEIDRLENRKSFVTVTVTEDNVEEDINFQHRWPVPIERVTSEVFGPSLQTLTKITIPNGVGPGQQITVQCPNGETVTTIIPSSNEWIFGDGRPYYQVHLSKDN